MYRKEGESRRSREQKFYEFFESLQLEYITAELRYRIYPDGEKREKSKDIMEKKKEKIKDIATRNSIKTIFEDICVGCTVYFDPCLKERLYAQIIPPIGFPNFVYRDELHRSQIEHLDKKFYYTVGERFSVMGVEGVLKAVDIRGGTAYLVTGGTTNSYALKEITRVF
jgi:hypothetical protein